LEWRYNFENIVFKVKPIFEEGKKYNSTDDVVRLWAYHDINFEKAEYPFNELVKLLSVIEPKFPLWIDIDISNYQDLKRIILNISMRFRKPSQLRNEGAYPPFRII